MSVKNFWTYFEESKEKLKTFSFTDDKLFLVSSELALKLIEADLKEKEALLAREKLKKEMEGLILQNKAQRKQLEIETLKSLVQAESMVRSVGDNAVINRANALVGFLNVVGNASESAAIANHSQNVINEIKKINDTALTKDYNSLLTTIRKSLFNEFDKQGMMKECFMIVPRTELKINETLEITALSVYPKNESLFVFKDKTFKNIQSLLFSSDESGEFEIIYKVKNNLGEWLEDRVLIKVSKD